MQHYWQIFALYESSCNDHFGPGKAAGLMCVCLCVSELEPGFRVNQGRNNGWKVDGDQGFDPNTGALASCRLRVGWVQDGVAHSRYGGPGVLPPKNWKLRCQILHSGDSYVH